MLKVLLCLAVGASFILANNVLLADVLYGGNGNQGANPGGLTVINQTNGSSALVGDPVTPGGLSGVAFNGSGQLFGSAINGAGSTSSLVLINPDTGGLVSTVGPIHAGATNISIGDLAFQPVTGVLFGIRSNADLGAQGGLLYTINTTTGAATLVGNTAAGAGGGIAFAKNGTLYQAAYNNNFDFPSLNTLNPNDASRLATLPINAFFDGLAVRSDGTIFATPSGSNSGLFTINPLTGQTTLLGNGNAGSPSDLDFREDPVVPEPVSVLIWLAGGLLAVASRWRQSRRFGIL